MGIYADVQKLEPGELVELFELDLSDFGESVQRFHGYGQIGPIWWQGNEYHPWAIESEGFGRTGDSQQPQPSLRVGNIGVDDKGEPIAGVITALCIAYDDLLGAKIVVHQTFGRYLDAANFPDGNPEADPEQELPPEIWFIQQKSSENPESVDFTLGNALSFDGLALPNRQVLAGICPWLWIGGYRGACCGYAGSACFKADDSPTNDPTQDVCGGRLSSCKIRFGAKRVLNFGGFPAADETRFG